MQLAPDRAIYFACAIGVSVAIAWVGAPVASQASPRDDSPQEEKDEGEEDGRAQFLSPPSDLAAIEIARGEVARSLKRSARSNDEEHRVEEEYTTPRTGVTHIRLRQYLHGIRVWNGDYAVHVDRKGRIVAAHDRFRGDRQARDGSLPQLTAEQAVRILVSDLGLDAGGSFPLLDVLDDLGHERVLAPGGVSQDAIPVKLVYVREPDLSLHLAWNVVIREPSGLHWWEANIDAHSGEILNRSDYVARDSYRVFPHPNRNPNDGPDSLVVDPADPVASPYAWHDLDGAAGADTQLTLGNNAYASDQDSGYRPSGTAILEFDFTPKFDQLTLDAPITNAFYWVNWLHDVHYHYGFDEPAGNFQENNYGRGGSAQDSIVVQIQDIFSPGNASFSTPGDGLPPIMSMGVFSNPPVTAVSIDSPLEIARDLHATPAQFGASLDASGISGSLVEAFDGVEGQGYTNTDACSPLSNAVSVNGKIALIDRGMCPFIDKVENAQNAGAIAVIVANNVPGHPIIMTGTNANVIIPSAGITQLEGGLLRDALVESVTTTLSTRAVPEVDSSYDNEILIHEFGHGISNRLTGGRFQSACLSQSQSAAMGEGWSDFWAIALVTVASDDASDARGVGTFALSQPITGTGFRNFPYSSELTINPLTFEDIATLNVPHGAGEVWAMALIEMYWNLVTDHGFDSDVTFGSGGNNTALELVMDALKLQPCNPTYLEARDAILQADLVSNQSANSCAIWRAFAKRGMGMLATAPDGAGSLAVVEDFSLPPLCVPEPEAWLGQVIAGLALVLMRRRGSA